MYHGQTIHGSDCRWCSLEKGPPSHLYRTGTRQGPNIPGVLDGYDSVLHRMTIRQSFGEPRRPDCCKHRSRRPFSHWAELPVQCFLLLIPPGIRALESGSLQRRSLPHQGRNNQSWSYLRITDIRLLVNVWYPYPLFLNLCVQGA